MPLFGGLFGKKVKLDPVKLRKRVDELALEFKNALEQWEKVKYKAYLRASVYAELAARALKIGDKPLYERYKDKVQTYLIEYRSAASNVRALRKCYELVTRIRDMIIRGYAIEEIEKEIGTTLDKLLDKLSDTYQSSLMKIREAEDLMKSVELMDKELLKSKEIEEEAEKLIAEKAELEPSLTAEELINKYLEKSEKEKE